MKQVKTVRGRVIDMAALAKANEEVRAVAPGNTNMNARGDRLDSTGNVVATVQAVARKQHNTTTAPEKRKLSDAPTASKKASTNKKAEKLVVRKEEKARDDGTRYLEIEYEDSSMEVKELGNE
jgi:hypothetical protein